MSATLTLHVPARIEREIKRLAKRCFPRECYGLVLGTVAGDRLDIDDLFIPEDLDEYCTDSNVYPQPHWFDEAAEIARDDGLTCIGWFHSHPYSKEYGGGLSDRSQSEADLDSARLLVSGVCVVSECRTGRLRSSLRWWGPTIQLQVVRE